MFEAHEKGFDGLIRKAEAFAEIISSSAVNKENILITTHHDGDGICAATLLSEFILKEGGHSQIRTVSEPNIRFLEKLSQAKFDLKIFVDICAGLSQELDRFFGKRWLVIDHHELGENEMQNELILNPWQFGIDGDKEISGSGLCYYITEKNRSFDSAFLAIVGALSDRQDNGPRRSLTGLNAKILEKDSQTFKSIGTSVDLLFPGREWRPIHESIAFGLTCFIPGLTGNRDACLASLRSAGLELKIRSKWRSLSNLSEEEKQQLLEAIVPHLAGTTNTVEDLVGSVYTQVSQDEYSPMRDGRDLSLILNAFGRMGKAGQGIQLCIGNGRVVVSEWEQIANDYRNEVIRCVQALTSNEDRFREKNNYVIVMGDGIVGERMTGAVCQVLASLARLKNKVVFLRTTTQDGDVKISTRTGRELARNDSAVNLAHMMKQIVQATSGVGGGLSYASGARFSIVKQQEFQVAVDRIFSAPISV